jgi:hypothetical protein
MMHGRGPVTLLLRALCGASCFALLCAAGIGAQLPGLPAAHAPGQTPTNCIQEPLGPDTHTSVITVDSQTQTFIGGGVLVRCPSRKIVLRSDSAEVYSDRYYMVGHVRYTEPRLNLTSNFLNYFLAEERVTAVGDVHATLPSGSTLVGVVANLLRKDPRIRPHDQMTATNRPTITIIQRDSAGKAAPPITVIANTVFMDADSLVYAGGDVTISNPEISAAADSALIDSGHQTMQLMRNPHIEGKRARPYTLKGDLIDLYSRNRKLDRVVSRANAVAKSEDMTLTSDTITLRIANDLLQRTVAWGTTRRAQAVTPQQTITADSVDVVMPNQRVQTVHATGNALAEGKPDTTEFKATPPDTLNVLRGDTIIATFDTLAAKDTTRRQQIRQVDAIGHASAVYLTRGSDSTAHGPAIDYVRASKIVVLFDQQRVALVTAVGTVAGLHLDPAVDTAAARATPVTVSPTAPKSIVPIPIVPPSP